ncbi:MAG: 50S ribosomal protein L17 [Candidatus Magasanikbacteria bacterium CG_4_9_14_3_um_filter_32_9]|uniref:Large ribosomal subunit protein bL17 n=1 Tax=Candidatus Magasanikbacteria bacterium CG_4_9_14_3_um_filter_32_9 TaxID=1974644 RepID=A0A2M7Z607_9BACT|nr:MAG: 50S ribosomal protein L17 [Candidatus Magasanikbacteria bacterium CG_4_9_14_3_um_filter_32_9]
MRHRKQKFTLGREKAARTALIKNLAESLILHGSIKTTEAKAKALRTYVEPLVTKARKNTLATRRLVISKLFTEEAVKKLMEEVGPKYVERDGGYTRIIKLENRKNDGAPIVKIEFV